MTEFWSLTPAQLDAFGALRAEVAPAVVPTGDGADLVALARRFG